MGEDWSREEVEATVADYLSMLDAELLDQPYNKTEHRRRLSALLNSRSDGAVERKHQNISAVLIDLGFPPIKGYKPLFNYQRLLFDVVVERLGSDTQIEKLVETQTLESIVIPTVDDILSCLVEAPLDPDGAAYDLSRAPERHIVPRRVDYLAQEARNRSVGAAGEEFVLRFEIARLLHAHQERLAQRVEHVSVTRGDHIGYDILSFEESGRDRLVEVKTTRYGRDIPFYVTRNELDTSRDESDRYYLYRVFDFRNNPRLFLKQGYLDKGFALKAVLFRAAVS